MTTGRFLLAFAAASLAIATPGLARDKRDVQNATAAGAMASATAPQTMGAPQAVYVPQATPDYKIGPNDTLQITVLQVPDLTRTVQVDTGGNIMMPLVGKMSVSGMNANELADAMKATLEKSYMKNAQVTVMVTQMTTQRVTVDGAVNQPGMYPLAGPTSLMQALALARGPDTRIANLGRVAIFRAGEGGMRVATVYDLEKIRDGKVPDPIVRADDIVVVDSSGMRTFLRDFSAGFPLVTWMLPY
jgi:polysaccharide biosynthesis/export protein